MTTLFLLTAVLLAGTSLAEQEIVTPMAQQGNERRLSVDGRSMMHMHLQTTPLYGNSTDFMYYYMTMYFGSQAQPQTLIVDTGSSVAAIPCKEFCTGGGSCGKHIHDHFSHAKSETFHLFSCTEVDCRCAEENKCRFYQGYAEGSRYEGYVARDKLYFGENFHYGVDMFDYTFGCVKTETKYFFSQEADGILGLSSEKPHQNLNRFEPIYDVMFEQKIIEKRIFSMCLGKNGGYIQMGGYDGTGHFEKGDKEIQWVDILHKDSDFKVTHRGVMMNNHFMANSDSQKVAFIDSGTTFTYMNSKTFNAIKLHFQWFCSLDASNHCKGTMDFSKYGYLCFSYTEKEFPDGPYDFFRSFPILRFLVGSGDRTATLNWYPSEYLYRENKQKYCVAIDVMGGSEIIIGGTLMRQHNFIFDVDGQKIGMARATCNEDPNQIFTENELILAGQRYGLDPSHTESVNEVCDHTGSTTRKPRTPKKPDPQPRVEDFVPAVPEEPEVVTEPEKPEDFEKPEGGDVDDIVWPAFDGGDETVVAKVDEDLNLVIEPAKDPNVKIPEPVEEAQTKTVTSNQEWSRDIKHPSDSSTRKKHADDTSSSGLVVPVLICLCIAGACGFVGYRYMKGRGSQAGGSGVATSARSLDQYAVGASRDATVHTAQDGFVDNPSQLNTSTRRGRFNSNRSGEQHQLELQADTEDRQVHATDPDSYDDDHEEYDDESSDDHRPSAKEQNNSSKEEEEEEEYEDGEGSTVQQAADDNRA